MESFLLSKTGRHPIEQGNIIPRVLSGDVVLMKGALHSFGVHGQISLLTKRTIEDQCGAQVAADVANSGFEGVHRFLSGDQIENLFKGVHHRLLPNMPPVIKAFGEKLLGLDRPFYVNSNSVIRFFVPHTVLQESYATFSRYIGKLDLHGPHHDIYQDVALNAINLWMAVGPVEKNNGLAIFSDVWGQTLPRGKSHVRDDQYLGEPLLLECDPGDIVLFHSHHLHSSVLNSTDNTRYVVTSRFTIDPPVHPNPERRFQYLRSDLIGRVSLKDACTNDGRIATPAELASICSVADTVAVSSAVSTSALADNEILALDKKTCVARINGELLAFGRRCTHQGADLSLGYVKDGQIHCPWHNVSFDPATGESLCPALKSLKTFEPPDDSQPIRMTD